jgi:hypothetical protein
MNKNAIFLAISIAAVLAVALAPSLGSSVSAVKEHTDPICEGDPQEREECPGSSGDGNPNREQIEEKCTAGSKGENSPNCPKD